MRDWISELKRQQKQAEDLRREIAALDTKRSVKLAQLKLIELRLGEAMAVLRGDEPVKPKSRHGFVGGKRAKPIQQGSSVWWTAKVLYLLGKPTHINKLLERIKAESGEVFKKNTLVSNLSRYVRYGDTFNRPAPNVFGLIDFDRDIEATALPLQPPTIEFENEDED
jgi:hypothetical protein